jgi:hypothetical protein
MYSSATPENGTIAQCVLAEKIEFEVVKNIGIVFFENNVKNTVFSQKFVFRLIFHADHEFVNRFEPRKLISDPIKISYDHNSLRLKLWRQNLSKDHFA